MKKWDKFEVNYLKENYETKTNREISKVITRSNKALIYMAMKLGLKKTQETICQARRHKSFEITKELLEKMYLRDKKSIRKIALELKFGKNTIAHYLNKFNMPLRTTSEANKSFYKKGGKVWKEGLTKKTDKRIEKATEKMKESWNKKRAIRFSIIEKKFDIPIKDLIGNLYWNDKLNQEEIAKKLELSRVIIINLMKFHNIKKRLNYQHISSLKGENHSMYGKKWEETYGIEEAKKLKAELSIRSRTNIIKRLSNNEMPFINTKIEKKLAKAMENKGIKFIHQYPIDNKFVCDFAIPEFKIMIECDGDYWHANPRIYNKNNLNQIQKRKVQTDKFKDIYLSKKGWKVLRFFESDIKKSIANCISSIEKTINSSQII
ncbi:MAG: DUF559 domain-containing protein [archaeon]|nr:DUF559 domain-containing protein [archaeon]